MERKIGEIFECNGEWYQCIPDTTDDNCNNRFFQKRCSDIVGDCSSTVRSDGKSVAFKKLEKTGEPLKINGKAYQGLISPYEFNNCSLCAFKNISCKEVIPCYDDYIFIEIKQNKEDMEEKKQKIDDLVGLYSSGKITYKELDKELKALYDKEESEPTLKEFDIEAAKQGKPVYTRDGRKVRIICFDAKCADTPIVALVSRKNEEESLLRYYRNGKFRNDEDSDADLMMLPEKKEGWVNVYDADTTFYFVDGMVYDTKEEAIKHINPDNEIYTTSAKIEFEK